MAVAVSASGYLRGAPGETLTARAVLCFDPQKAAPENAPFPSAHGHGLLQQCESRQTVSTAGARGARSGV